MLNLLGSDDSALEYLDSTNRGLIAALSSYMKHRWHLVPEFKNRQLQETLEVVVSWKMPANAVLATVVWHLIDNKISLSETPVNLDHEVLEMAYRLQAVSHSPVTYTTPHHLRRPARVERLRTLFVTAYTDITLALLCLAVHIVRMGSIETLNHRDARLLAEDNEAIFLPLTEFLGMWQLRRELADLSLKFLNRRLWHNIRQRLELARGEQQEYIEDICTMLEAQLSNGGIEAVI